MNDRRERKMSTSSHQRKRDIPTIVQDVLNRYADEPGALLPILHALQEALGHIPPGVVPDIADALNLSRAEVHGVISYYHDFHTEPVAAHRLQICRAEACQTMGADALFDHARKRLACSGNDASENGEFPANSGSIHHHLLLMSVMSLSGPYEHPPLIAIPIKWQIFKGSFENHQAIKP